MAQLELGLFPESAARPLAAGALRKKLVRRSVANAISTTHWSPLACWRSGAANMPHTPDTDLFLDSAKPSISAARCRCRTHACIPTGTRLRRHRATYAPDAGRFPPPSTVYHLGVGSHLGSSRKGFTLLEKTLLLCSRRASHLAQKNTMPRDLPEGGCL